MDHEIQRSKINSLTNWNSAALRKPLLLLGARQVGKTRLLRKFAAEKYQVFHYFNFEETRSLHSIFVGQDLTPSVLLSKLALHLGRQIQPASDLIIFDEIQACPEALTSLKYFCEHYFERGQQLHLCASGSLLGIGLSSGSYPVGKVDTLELYPVTFDEFLVARERSDLHAVLSAHDLHAPLADSIHALCWDLWREYLILGGLPEVIAEYLSALQAPEALSVPPLLAARTLQSRIVQAYESDVAKHSGKVNAMHVVRVLEAIPAQMMRAIEGIERARRFIFKDVVPGIRGYAQLVNAIDWLVAAHLVQRIPIANSGLSPLRAFTQENIFKLYLLDVGVLGALVGLSPHTLLQYEFGTYKGAIAEQYVAQELRASGISGLSCWQEGQSEVEFAIEGSTSSIPIEVKSGQRTMAKSLAVFEKKYAPPVSVVLSGKAHGLDASRRRIYLPIYLAHRIGELR